MNFDKSILREADIRGVYPDQINSEFAKRLGCVFGTYAQSVGKSYCVVGHDNRFGGPDLTKNLIEGLISTGINVMYIGLVTTPMFNFASRSVGQEYGIMVTASHNPSNDNGFKIFGRDYQHCDYDELDIIYDALKNENYKLKTGKGTIEHIDVTDAYAEFLAKSINLKKKDMKVVVDCGNGTASTIIKKVYDLIPCEVVYLFCDSNPNFPNHHPDPNVKSNLEKLAKSVKKNRADLGLAYDGDADRCGFVDNKGNIVEADIMMALLCKDIIKNNQNKTILIDVKCSKALEDAINEAGGNVLIETPSSAKQERVIASQHINFGGDYSNHIFFADKHPGYDDGIYVGLRVQEMLSVSERSLSDLTKKLHHYYNTEEIKVKTTDEKKFKIVEDIKKYCDNHSYEYSTIDGIKVFVPNGWALIRASNTGPNLTLRFESTTESGLKKIKEEFMGVVDIFQK